jgi:hypothetical protein
MKQLFLFSGMLALLLQVPLLAQDAPVSREELEEVKGALTGLSESFTEYRGFVDALRKIKISGYMQPQYRYTDVMNTPYNIGVFSGGLFPANTKSMFQVRRARVKVTYDNVLTQFVLQIDAIQSGVSLKDAYVMVTEPWTKAFGFQMGVFDRPFGYEISYSSSSRESPERSRIFQTLFPGERELGAKLFYAPQMGPLSMMRADVGVFNGSGPTANEFDNFKDIIGHVSYQLPFDQIGLALDLGVSGYFGNVRNNTRYLYISGTLADGTPGYAVDSTATNFSAGVPRQYLGVDAQLYYDLPVLGGMILRGEYIFGKQAGTSATSISTPTQFASGIYQRDFSGWYLSYIQNIGNANQFVLKYDIYDPNSKVSGADFVASNTTGSLGLNATDLKYSTLGLGWIHHWDDNVKVVFYYEMVANEKLVNLANTTSSLALYSEDVSDNVFTFRVQYKF